MTILFWDIDGTLLSTGRAGMYAWEDAASELAGRPIGLDGLKTAGATDHQIGEVILGIIGLPVSADTLGRLVGRYGDLLPRSLPRRQGRVLPNVRETLEHLRAERPDVRSMLLTGNTREGARAKLTHYGLQEFFPAGAFSSGPGERSAIATRALECARQLGPVARDRLFVIGDTPHDIRCATAISARAIGVATGEHAEADLLACGAWLTFPELPPPLVFVAALGLDGPPASAS